MELKRNEEADLVTVVLPEYVPDHWWEHILHGQSAQFLKLALLFTPGFVVTSIRRTRGWPCGRARWPPPRPDGRGARPSTGARSGCGADAPTNGWARTPVGRRSLCRPD